MHPSLSDLHSQEVRRRQAEVAAKYDLMRQSQDDDQDESPEVSQSKSPRPKKAFTLKVYFLSLLTKKSPG